MDPGAFLAQNWTIQIPSNLSHPCLPTQSLAQSPVPSVHMHRQVVNTGCGDDDFFLVGAAALYGQRKLGWRAATLPSSTELIYIFVAVGSMRLLPASGLLSPAFAPARRAHPATDRPVLSPLSPGAAACTPPWRPLCGRGRLSRAYPGRGPSSGAKSASRPKISAPAAGRERSWRPPDGTAGAIECGFPTELGVLFIGARCGGQVENC